MKRCWTADFETTTDPEDCRVWAWAMSEIGNPDNMKYGTTIEDFISELYELGSNDVLYFHNLKFDGQFICYLLEQLQFEWKESACECGDMCYTTMISDTGAWYKIDIYFERTERVSTKSGRTYIKLHHIQILDSLKILNFSVAEIAKSFNLPISKLKIDYHEKREIGHQLTQEEKDYIKNDVQIMAMALEKMFERGLNKMTAASNALSNYKKNFCDYFMFKFPVFSPELDAYIRDSYKGGFTYLNPLYKNQTTGAGVVLDINSAYPYMLHSSSKRLLPYGEPIEYQGEYQDDYFYPLFVQQLTCRFKLKEGKIPSIQTKNHFGFIPTEYLTSSKGELMSLTLTDVDMKLFFEQYDVEDLEFERGWKFHGRLGMFDDYINYWMKEKQEGKRQKDNVRKLIAKLQMNSLYGKFGTSPDGGSKRPVMDEDGTIYYEDFEETRERKPLYIPIATWATSYTRDYIIRSAQFIRDWSIEHKGFDAYVYSDTDSLHVLLTPDDVEQMKKEGFNIDDYALGAWKLEEEFRRGKYLHSKCYIEDILTESGYELNVTVAGLPKELSPVITFANFKPGFTTAGMDLDKFRDKDGNPLKRKLNYRAVPGGVILEEVDFTIKDS